MASFRTAVDCNTNVANSIKIQNLDARITEAVELLKQLIATPSRSRDEARTADLLHAFLAQRGAAPERLANNVWARAEGFDPARPTLLLNSHHDTVRPAASYTRDPYAPTVEDGKLYGLGSNDAGASVVCLLETFLTFRTRPLPFNLVLGISAEEECMGENGIRALLPALGKVDMARLRSFRFGRESELLGPIGIAVTQIEAGTQHNVVPDTCRFVVDVRPTDAYSNEETVGILRAALRSEAVPRSTRIRAAAVGGEHPLVKAAVAAGRETYVSPTTSDRTLMPFPALKMGPGQSSRSHTADEFVLLEEIAEGIAVYEKYIGKLAQEYGWKTLG